MIRCSKCGRAVRNTGQFWILCLNCETGKFLFEDGRPSKYRRKYTKGALIRSMDELVEQDFVYQGNRIVAAGWFRAWQLNYALKQIKDRSLRRAVKIEQEVTDGERVSH